MLGGTLALDGWTSVSSGPLINAMLVSWVGELFLEAMDTTEKEKDVVYMATIIAKYIEQIGKESIIQVYTANVAVMLNAKKTVHQLYPHIYFKGCAAHAMDLLLKD